MNIFMPSLNILQDNKTQCTQIFAELSIFRNKLKSRIEHKYFGTNISQSLSNLGIDERKNFEKVTLNCYERSLKYLEKWFAFENNIFQKLDVLNLNYESIFDIVDTLNINLDKDMLFDEIILLNEFLEKKEFISSLDHIEKWIQFINICKAPNIEIILEIVFSIYSSNAYIERVFSIMNNICSDDRSKLLTPNLKAELCVKINYNFKCSQFYDYIKNNDKLLNACKSNSKYTFKLKK
jgi:hypothetical protein